jgi:hypothetical protein
MMHRADLLAEVRRLEDELLRASERIREVGTNDSLAGWLIKVLKSDDELARQFALPTEPKVTKALLVLLETDSAIQTPLITLLAQRVSAFVATIRDIAKHPLSSSRVSAIAENTREFVELLNRYEVNYDRRKTIPLVAESLKEHRSHIYKSSPRESDLRVALRAFYEDKEREEVEGVDFLLDFVMSELLEEVRHPGHLPQPRHAWWAVQTLLQEGRTEWLNTQRSSLNKVVAHLLSQVEYRPSRELDYTSFVPELHSRDNEDLWAAINGCKILSGDRAWILNQANSSQIVKKLWHCVSGVLSGNQGYSNLKLVQSRLILLYEALIYLDLQATLRLATARTLDLGIARIGIRYYDPAVIDRFRELEGRMAGLLEEPSRWVRGTLSSAIISGAPGQGKSELATQLIAEFGDLATAHGFEFDALQLAIGKEVRDEDDLAAALSWEGKEGTIYCRMLDEVDKAQFDVYAQFLSLLETETDKRTIWLFAQSAQPTFEQLRQDAEREGPRSLRDFLTRMQLGHVDVPSLAYSAVQKIYSALGMSKAINPGLAEVQRELLLELVRRTDVETNRDLMRIVAAECEVEDGLVRLKTPPARSLSDYLIGSKRVAPRKKSLKVLF